MLRCGECGAAVTAERQKGIVYYHCTGTRGPCSQREWTREDGLASQFTNLLLGLRIPQSFLDYSLDRLRHVHAAEAELSMALRRKLQGQRNTCQLKLDGLLQLKISPGNVGGALLSDDEFLQQKTAIRRDIEQLDEQLATVEKQGENWVDDCERFFAFTQRLRHRFEDAAIDDKRILLLHVCSNLTLKDRNVAAEYREPYATLAGFPLAGVERTGGFEPVSVHAVAENSELMAKWLHLVGVIRIHGAPLFAPADGKL